MSDTDPIEAATRRLSLALEALEAATERRREADRADGKLADQIHVLGGDRARLAVLLAHAIRMTFWPSLALIAAFLVLGRPLLWMFGRDFVAGYPLMFVLAIGLLARAAVGPAEKLLNMLGERRTCAHVYAGSFLLNLLLCLVLIPRFGAMGAAAASACALVFESACLFLVAKFRLGFHCIVFGSVSS